MGELIAFKQPASPQRRLAKSGQTAEILFFTGVRYVPPHERDVILKQIGQRANQQPFKRRRRERAAQH